MSYYARDLAHRFAKAEGSLLSTLCDTMALPFAFMPPPLRLLGNPMNASARMVERLTRQYDDPGFGYESTMADGEIIPVQENATLNSPFCDLLHFKRDTERKDPKVLWLAPMSGHYASLLRGSVEAFLPDHDNYITNWKNARDVPLDSGDFGLEDYVHQIEDCLKVIGPNTHVIAVCQPTVPAMAAVSCMAERNDSHRPLSLTLMGGPLDVRAAETDVTRFANEHSLDWFRQHVIERVPETGRLVYPGALQLQGFMSMNPGRHWYGHAAMFNDLVFGDGASASRRQTFYDDYLAVMDLPARFYLETIDQVFHQANLARGRFLVNGKAADPSAIRDTVVFTVEGEKDDIAAPGQTEAAQYMLRGLDPRHKFHHLQKGVGHYGLFNGSGYRNAIAPCIKGVIRHAEQAAGLNPAPLPAESRIVLPGHWDETQARPQLKKLYTPDADRRSRPETPHLAA